MTDDERFAAYAYPVGCSPSLRGVVARRCRETARGHRVAFSREVLEGRREVR